MFARKQRLEQPQPGGVAEDAEVAGARGGAPVSCRPGRREGGHDAWNNNRLSCCLAPVFVHPPIEEVGRRVSPSR